MVKPRQKIYINGRFLTQKVTGVQRYATEMVKALDYLIDKKVIDSDRFQLELLVPSNPLNILQLKHIPIKTTGMLKGHPWEQLELPYAARDGFLFNLCNVGPLLKTNQAVTIHDMAVYAQPENYSFIFRNWYKFLYTSLVRFSRQVFTVSSFSREEILQYTDMDERKLTLVPEGKEHIDEIEEDGSVLTRNGLEKQQYLLAVSSMNPNKNFKAIVESLEYLHFSGYKVVIAGGTNPRVFAKEGGTLPDSVTHLGYVSDEELKSLYRNAFCFIYPSFYEGFGLPPLEAMASGCPVIVSDQASLPEVCGTAAIYCNPHSPRDIAEKIKMLIENPKLRNQLSEQAVQQAAMFSWERAARQAFTEVAVTL